MSFPNIGPRIANRWRKLLVGLADAAPSWVSRLPSHELRIRLYRRLGAKIGPCTSVHKGCRFYDIRKLKIGPHCVINSDVILDAREGLSIGENVSISEQTAIYTQEHDLDDPKFATRGGPVRIEDYAFVGARALILPGVTIGKGAAVAAGAVVTRDVAPYDVVAGVPAKKIRERSRDLQYVMEYRRMFY